jgi:hypothetical protein
MATLAIAAMLPATASPFVIALATAAGAAIDSYFIIPSLTNDSGETPSLGSFDINFAEEGSPGRFVYGRSNRVPGHLIATETPHNTASSGSGKRKGPVQITWWADLVVVFSNNNIRTTDRIDFESNTVYLRDPNRDMRLGWENAPLKHEVFFDDQNSFVTWTSTGTGSAKRYTLSQWHMVIQNASVPMTAFTYPGTFVPGQNVSVSVRDSFSTNYGNILYGASGGSSSHGFKLPYWKIATPARGITGKVPIWTFKVIQSRNIGMATGTSANGATVTVPRSRLVVDVLSHIRGGGGRYHNGNTFVNGNFWKSVTEAEMKMFDPMGISNPLSYPDQGSGHTYPTGNLSSWEPGTTEYHIAFLQPGTKYADGQFLKDSNGNYNLHEHTGHYKAAVGWAPDPVYLAMKGSDWTPNLPGIAYWGLGDVNISKAGNRIPQMQAYLDARQWEHRARNYVELKISRMIEILLEDHTQLPSYLWDITFAGDQLLGGFQFEGLHEIRTVVAPLLIYGDIHVTEYGGKMRFQTRAERDTVSIGWHHLDARDWNSTPSPVLALEDQDMQQAPRRVHVKFNDIDKDHQFGDVYASKDSVAGRFSHSQRSETGLSTTRMVSFSGIPMTSADASAIGERVLSDAQEFRQRVKLRLPSWYINLVETDILKVGAYDVVSGSMGHNSPPASTTRYTDRDYYILIEQIDIGADFFVEVEGWVIEDDGWASFSSDGIDSPPGHTFSVQNPDDGSDTASDTASGTDDGDARFGTNTLSKLGSRPPTILAVMDIPPQLDAHCNKCGIYLAYIAPGTIGQQPATSLYENIGDGDDWNNVGTANKTSVLGTVLGLLEPGHLNVFDYSVTLTVDLEGVTGSNGGPESSTELEVSNGANFAAVGNGTTWEIIQFVTATEDTSEDLLHPSRWALTGLRRGLWGTEDLVAEHVSGADRFVLLDRSRIHFHEMDTAFVGLTRSFKVLAFGETVDEVTDEAIVIEGNSSLPLPVANLVGWRKSNGDIVFTWDRRSRARYRTFGTQQAPLVEVTESYDIVIDLSSDRTINVSAATGTYTAAMQSTDSKSGLEITATLYQRDSVRGRGRSKAITVAHTQKEVGTEDGSVMGSEDTRTINTPLGGGMD